MKYVVLIQSDPRPWGHPTSDFLPEYQAQPEAVRNRLQAEFDEGFAELMKRGEFVSGVALGDPRGSRLFRWRDGERLVTDGPYAEGKEHLAGFFLIDVESAERAEEIGRFFAGPGETVELRPVMEMGGPED